MEEGENGGKTGEGTAGDKPQNKEDEVDDEEGICSLQAEGNIDGVQGPMSKTQERNKDDAIKPAITSDIKHDLSMSQSEESVADREEDVRVKDAGTSIELTENMNEIREMNKADSAENTSESETACAIEDKMEEKKENVQQLSSETENVSTKTDQTSTVPITAQDQVKKKATSSRQGNGNINQANKNSQSSSTESVAELPSTKKQVTEGDKKIHMANKTEHGGKQAVEKVTRRTTSGEGKSPLKQKLETSGSDKSQNNLHRKSMSQKEQPTVKSKGGEKETPRVTQEKKSEKASTSKMTIRSSSPKTDAKAKTVMKSTLRADIDNKPTKSKSMELNKIERDSNEKVNQKQLKGNTSNALSSSHRVRSPGRNLLESSKQKSASTGTLTKNMDSPQKQQEAQNFSTQEKSNKSKKAHEIKDVVGKSPTKKSSVERGITKGTGIQSSADSVAEKIIHSSFQGTISRAAKCDEKLQRAGTTESKKNQDRINKVTAEISATTEAAIKEQFKQLESKIPHELSVNSTHTVPKQKPKSPTRKQQKPATQQKLNEQKQTLQQQQSPQKQKPPRSPTRKQEQKQLQQKQQTVKQQTPQKQQQTLKELSQPKQQTPQTQATNLSKQEKQQIEIKQSLQQQQEQMPTSPNDQKENKAQQQTGISVGKHNPNTIQENEQHNTGASHQKLKELQKQENKNEEQKLLYLKEMKDQEQKEECDHPMQQQDKQRIEQQNQQQKQWELKAAHIKPHEEKESGNGKQVDKEEQPEQEESKEHPKQQQQQQSEDGDNDNGRGCGMQGSSCPIYFGVKSYLHHFYDSTPVKNSHLYEEYIEEDDFEYAVDPIKNRGCRRCCRGFWFRAGLWGGINLILVGVITLLVGYLTPQREMVVGHHNNLEILDRSAIAFNRRLELCRLAGLAVFCCGGLVLLLTLLLSTFLHVGSHNNNNTPCCGDNAYYGYVATSLVEPFIAAPNQTVPISTGIKIPITEQIKSVQPTLWPDIATVKDGTLVPHMP